jgi:hypothetical protein
MQELREKLKATGLDPDKDPDSDESIDYDTLLPMSGYRFECQWCEHTEAYELDEDSKIIPKKHHGQPMFLRIPRRDSDY